MVRDQHPRKTGFSIWQEGEFVEEVCSGVMGRQRGLGRNGCCSWAPSEASLRIRLTGDAGKGLVEAARI